MQSPVSFKFKWLGREVLRSSMPVEPLRVAGYQHHYLDLARLGSHAACGEHGVHLVCGSRNRLALAQGFQRFVSLLLARPKYQINAVVTGLPVRGVLGHELCVCSSPDFSVPLSFDFYGEAQRSNTAGDIHFFVASNVGLRV